MRIQWLSIADMRKRLSEMYTHSTRAHHVLLKTSDDTLIIFQGRGFLYFARVRLADFSCTRCRRVIYVLDKPVELKISLNGWSIFDAKLGWKNPAFFSLCVWCTSIYNAAVWHWLVCASLISLHPSLYQRRDNSKTVFRCVWFKAGNRWNQKN